MSNDIDKMNMDELKGLVKKLREELQIVKRRSSNKPLSETLGDETGGLLDIATSLTNQLTQAREVLMDMSSEGMAFASGGPLARAIGDTTFETDALLGSAKAGAQAFKNLSSTVSGFAQMNNATIKGTKSLSSELSTQAAVLSKLGLSMSSFSKNVDMAVYSFGLAADGVKGLNMEIVKMANEVNMLPEQLSRNFQMVAKNLAYDFSQIKQQFVEIQKLSSQTGVSVDTLVGKFGQPLDTIGGASGFAAQINSLLGSNAFSTTELLMMDEATRMKTVRERIMADQSLTGALGAGGVTRKFALQSISSAIGLSMDDTRRFLETGQTGSVKEQTAAQLDKDFTGQADAFAKGLDDSDLSRTLKDFVTEIRRTQLSVMQQQLVTNREAQLRAAATDDTEYGQSLRALQETGVMAEMGIDQLSGIETSTLTKAVSRSNQGENIKRLVRMRQMFQNTEIGERLIPEERVNKILTALGEGPGSPGFDAAMRDMESIINDKQFQNMLSDARVGTGTISAVKAAPEDFGAQARIVNEVIRKFENSEASTIDADIQSKVQANRDTSAPKEGQPRLRQGAAPVRPPGAARGPTGDPTIDTDTGRAPEAGSVIQVFLTEDKEVVRFVQKVVDGKIETMVKRP